MTAVIRTFCVALALVFLAPAARAETVTQTMGRAQKELKAGKSKVAMKLLAGILRRYPDFQPAHLLMGKIYFRGGHVSAAAKHFRRVSPDLITPDSAYEYGITMFQIKDCRKAHVGLGRVAPTSKLADLANFYRGICYMRSRDWVRAEAFLNRAENVPSHLEATRREALTQVRAAEQTERGGQPSGPAPSVIFVPAPPAPSYYDSAFGSAGGDDGSAGKDAGGKDSGGKDAAGKDKDPKKPPPPPPPPAAGLDTAVTPSLTYTQKTIQSNLFGFKTTESDSQATDLKISVKSKYTGAQRSSGGAPYASLQLDFAENSTDTQGTSVQFIAYSNDPSNVIQQPGTATSGTSKSLTAGATPEVSWPFSGNADVVLGYKLSQTYPDFKADAATGTKGPYAAFDLSGKIGTLKVTGGQTENFDHTGTTTETDQTAGVDFNKAIDTTTIDLAYQMTTATQATKPPPGVVALAGAGGLPPFDGTTSVASLTLTKNWETFSLTADVVSTTYTPSNPAYIKQGEDSSMKVDLTGSKTLEIGGSVTVTLTMNQLGAYKQPVDDPSAPPGDPTATPPTKTPQVIVKTDGTQQTALVSFKLAPVDWVFGQVSYQYQQQAFASVDPKLESEFDLAPTPETTTTFTIQVGLTKTF